MAAAAQTAAVLPVNQGKGKQRQREPSSHLDDTTTNSTASPGSSLVHLNPPQPPSASYNISNPSRSTRSRHTGGFDSLHLWEALDIQSHRAVENPQITGFGTDNMSRNRPRGAARDNYVANEEVEMFNQLKQSLEKAKEKRDKQDVLGLQIQALDEKIAKAGRRPTLAEVDLLDSYHRQYLKLNEEEKAILDSEPAGAIKNTELLGAMRKAAESEGQPSRSSGMKQRKGRRDAEGSAADSPAPSMSATSDKLNRLKGSSQRSASVSSNQAREGVSAYSEESMEGVKGTAAEKNGQLFVGAEVVYKNHTKTKREGEELGIQCIIKATTGEGRGKRYEVHDPVPNEKGEQGQVYKTTAANLIPIPQVGSPLPSFSVGKQVLARYPDTTTFYYAEVMGSKKDVYRLKFEGEEDDKEMEVDRRFVFDIPGK
ncbi:hypothetical protein AJ80_04740 [Polytolypa hystricis UAMH7299]|uniref:SGF29 C-terminal domain-containing protein n=1 Tax=Polytolypa hystricis (strain UAMH7299) TaxID=1447883 RepID=A0A2B7Y9M0_POLH7|nr:hypothetical protein AJ80_04740 [Polytolypa hystricis UAMH7299]